MFTLEQPTSTIGRISQHHPDALRRRDMRHEIFIAELSRARRLRRWSDRLGRAATWLSRAAAGVRASAVSTRH
ncbi:hypothetical protein [Phytoactinopolyspora mesophila]|uniref:Uncharacterized protein n=1 Tax=Phytoactinopolyspora mesophila TaxID=2650750 RepID=A0A7K3MAC9_9ACTN|nr:hypothetical protein [Phytoactinopolyspora mesophila]NDL59348.1 hypothetical protein [Phytoactinopolyspora mesophila]